MTEEAQRIAIAEACGWKLTTVCMDKRWRHPEKLGALPDYLNDLNAMHEAETVLTGDNFYRYQKKLQEICRNNEVFASAAQRAEAFLRTIGKWDDSK